MLMLLPVKVNTVSQKRDYKKNVIRAGAWAFNTVLKIYSKSFSIHLAIDGAINRAFGVKIGWLYNTKRLESSSKSMGKMVNLKNIEMNEFIGI